MSDTTQSNNDNNNTLTLQKLREIIDQIKSSGYPKYLFYNYLYGMDIEEDKPIEIDETTYINPIIAYRSWSEITENYNFVKKHHGKSTIWEHDKALKAECLKDYYGTKHYSHSPQEVPHPSCMCGIFSLKEKQEINYFRHGKYIGETYIWGKIIEHKKGYRAEYAYPRQVYYNPLYQSFQDLYFSPRDGFLCANTAIKEEITKIREAYGMPDDDKIFWAETNLEYPDYRTDILINNLYTTNTFLPPKIFLP